MTDDGSVRGAPDAAAGANVGDDPGPRGIERERASSTRRRDGPVRDMIYDTAALLNLNLFYVRYIHQRTRLACYGVSSTWTACRARGPAGIAYLVAVLSRTYN